MTLTSAIKYHYEYKPGGTANVVCSPWHSRVIVQRSDAPLGRWSYTTLHIKGNRGITILIAYRVCKQSKSPLVLGNQLGVRNLRTYYMQQLEVYATQGVTNKDPRHAFIEDLKQFTLDKTYSEDYLVVRTDTNESRDLHQAWSVFDILNSLALKWRRDA